MLFSLNTEVIVDCFPSGFSDKKDQWTTLNKAILVPFLEPTENSFKAMQKRELFHTALTLLWEMELKTEVEFRTFPV